MLIVFQWLKNKVAKLWDYIECYETVNFVTVYTITYAAYVNLFVVESKH